MSQKTAPNADPKAAAPSDDIQATTAAVTAAYRRVLTGKSRPVSPSNEESAAERVAFHLRQYAPRRELGSK